MSLQQLVFFSDDDVYCPADAASVYKSTNAKLGFPFIGLEFSSSGLAGFIVRIWIEFSDFSWHLIIN